MLFFRGQTANFSCQGNGAPGTSPGLNGDQVTHIACRVKDLGATVMNVMPVIPQAEFSGITPPTPEELSAVQTANEQIISQFRHCRQCRADAIGLVEA
jgi:nitrogen fixation protein NifB